MARTIFLAVVVCMVVYIVGVVAMVHHAVDLAWWAGYLFHEMARGFAAGAAGR